MLGNELTRDDFAFEPHTNNACGDGLTILELAPTPGTRICAERTDRQVDTAVFPNDHD